jgi:pyruvate/2-oxoglutarate dehydrogenase complex dihydrolipoamide acyltransferase (E2) component
MEKINFELKTPDLGDTEKIELVKWYKKPGDSVSVGDEILELVTDKAAFPMESPKAGVLAERMREEGDLVKRGEVLGLLHVHNEQKEPSGQ